MNVVSIAELAASDIEENTNYATYGAYLTGEIEFIENSRDPTSDYECFMLLDPESFTGMKCRLTVFDRSILGKKIIAKTWHLRYLTEPLIDICMLETVTEAGSHPICTLLKQSRIARAQTMIEAELQFKALPFIDSVQDRFDIFSIIITKSPVFLDQNKKPYFILQIASDDMTAFVVFRGKNLRMHYQEIAVEMWYALTNLKMTTISDSDQHVFMFDGETSDFCQLIDEQVAYSYEKLAASITMPTRSEMPIDIVQPWERSKNESDHSIRCYGRITNVIDPILGFYIMDDILPICLAQSPTYFPLSAYWEGAVVNIQHAHIVTLHSNELGSALLDQYFHCASQSEVEQERSWRVIVCCIHTQITVEQLPDHNTTVPQPNPSMLKAFLSKNAFIEKYGFMTMVTWLEAFLSLKRKARDADTYVDSLVHQTDTLLQSIRVSSDQYSPRNLVEDFLSYHECTVFPQHTLSEEQSPFMNLPNYPTLSQLTNISNIPNLQQIPLSSSVNTDNPLANIPLQAWTYKLSDTKPDYCVLVGYISGGSDGRLYFADNTGRIPLIMIDEEQREFSHEVLYIFNNCTIVEEDLGYIDDSGNRVDSQCRYLVVKSSSVVSLQPIKSQITFCTSIPSTLEQDRIFAYEQDPNLPFKAEDHLNVMYVQHIPASNLQNNEHGKQYLSCTTEIVLFDLVNSDRITTSSLGPKAQKCTLVFTSDLQSLALLPQIKPKRWYVLVNISGGEPSSPSTLRLNEKSGIYPIISNGGHFKLRQFTHMYQSAVKPASSVASKDLDVKDLISITLVNSDLDEPSILSNSFHRHLVSFEAYVITKNFTESAQAGGEPDKYAQILYDNLTIGTGKPNRWLFLKLRSINSQNTIDVYFNVGRKPYPIGLVSGCKIKIHKAALKVSERTKLVYVVMLPSSGIEIINIPTDHKIRDDIEEVNDVEKRILADYLRDPSNRVYETVCYVKSVQQVSLSWVCLECGQVVINDNCYGMCAKGRRLFVAQAVATVTDGTADITVSIEGEDMVITLLRLSNFGASKLKEATYMHGEMVYSNWFAKEEATIRDASGTSSGANLTSRGRTLHSICTNPDIFSCVSLQAKRVVRRGDYDKNFANGHLFGTLQVLPVKLVSNDPEAALQSLVYARVRLHVLRINPIDVIEQANALL
ncbi:hypothetical protein INT43_006889 [Umbelopsis isabellina]|uniref:CST complex subunit CTC1 n=1 Tax=Mortierella isabellina TaxID=91625 RepID=A0A8H7PWK9_MORIS|nr:hypothetical protein INT43_006889 [Umbelopsis isabellina]